MGGHRKWMMVLAAAVAGGASAVLLYLAGQYKTSWISYLFAASGGVFAVITLQLVMYCARRQ